MRKYIPCDETCAVPDLQTALAATQARLFDVLHVLSRIQPAGSPPPGDDLAWTQWVVSSTQARVAELTRQVAAMREEMNQVMAEVTRLAPAGSPPPGGPVEYVRWVRDALRAQLAQINKLTYRSPCSLCEQVWGITEEEKVPRD